jgi:hypothetical protein
MKKLFILLSMAAVVAILVIGLTGALGKNEAPTVYASRLAGIQAQGVTGINVQNLDETQAATVVADFYKQPDGAKTQYSVPAPVPAGGVVNINLPGISILQNGAYAAIISADRQIAAIARTDWNESGGTAIYSNVVPSTDVVVPLALKDRNGSSSLVSVQNTDPSTSASATVMLYAQGQDQPIKTLTITLPPGSSQTLDLLKDTQNFPETDVPKGFQGSMRVTSSTPMAVQSFVDRATYQLAVYAFEGIPADQAATKLYAPLFRHNYRGNSGFSVVNTENTDVTINVTYYGTLGDCKGQGPWNEQRTIAANSSVVVYQGAATNNPIPENCGGAAVIESTGKILAIVNDESEVSGMKTAAAYDAFTDADGATAVALPLYRKNHTAKQLTTGIQAMNIGTSAAQASIVFSPSGGRPVVSNCSVCNQTIEPLNAYTWLPTNISELPDKVYGSASITSSEPLVVIVNDKAYAVEPPTDAAIYSGIKAK